MLHRWIQLFTWRRRTQMRFACAHLTAVLCASMSLAQVRTTPTQVPNVTAPGPQKPAQAEQQRQQPLPGTRAPQPILQAPGAGTVEGFVYWDTASVSHTPASTCSGLAVNVAVGNSSGGKSNAYKPLGILTNNFKYVGQVKQFLSGGKIKAYDVCTYGYDHVPVGPDLRVTVIAEGSSPTQAGPFSPASVPQVDPVGPITIVNGQCNMLPRIVNPTASDLFAHWGSCQNMAYDVNFMMQPAQKVLSSGGSGVSSASGAHGGMLSSSTQQQGMLTSRAASSSQPQSTDGGLLGNRGQASSSINGGTPQTHRQGAITDITNRGTSAPATPESKVELNPQPFPPKMATSPDAGASKVKLNPQPLPPRTGNDLQRQASPAQSSRQTLTNAQVIRMVNQGLPESVIVHTIQSSTKQFDFSREGMQALQEAHVSPGVLAAMCDGSVRSCAAISGSAPSATPGNKATPSARTVLKPIKLGDPKPLRKITNPRLAEINAGIIAVLQQQRQTAEQESSAMKAGKQTVTAAASARTPALSANFHGNTLPQGLGPQTKQGAPGNLSSSIVHAPAFNSIALTCSTDPTPRILRVGGGQAQAVFTPEAKYNLYTIVGCSFGQSQSGNSAYIFAGNGFKANFNIDFWSDNGITAHLDPYLAGVLDQSNVGLVVSPAGKQQIEKQGFKFYAARGMPNPDGSDQEVALAYDSMRQSSVATFDIPNLMLGVDQLPSNATSNFPSFSFQGTPVAAWIFRYGYGHCDRVAALRTADCYANGNVPCNGTTCNEFFEVGTSGFQLSGTTWMPWPLKSDTWDFSKLAPGFQISDYQLYVSAVDPKTLCGAWADMDHTGFFDPDWAYTLTAQNQIVVTWAVNRCEDNEFGTRDNMAVQSAYGLAIWVLGPRCVDPWTGQKDQPCMNKVKQIL
jgi:hypothetical protein